MSEEAHRDQREFISSSESKWKLTEVRRSPQRSDGAHRDQTELT